MQYEKIRVYICFEHGRTVCICHRRRKGCGRRCTEDTVLRDRFEGWEESMNLSRYGPEKQNGSAEQTGGEGAWKV